MIANIFEASGTEQGYWALQGTNPSGNQPVSMGYGVNFKAAFPASPSSVTLTKETGVRWSGQPSVSMIRPDGFTVYGTSDSAGPIDPDPDANAVGPELVAVIPNEGGTIVNDTVLNIAPLELKFLFNEHQIIDPDTLGAIQIVRAGAR